MVSAIVIEDEEDLEAHRPEWDRLAEEAGRPYAVSAWPISWWRYRDRDDWALRVVVVVENGEVVAVAPLFAESAHGRARYAYLGAGSFFRAGPLVSSGRERELGKLIVNALATAVPRPSVVRFDGVDAACPLAPAVAAGWPGGRARLALVRREPGLTVELDPDGYDAWFSSKSKNFRRQMRKGRVRLARAGGTFRLSSTEDDLKRDLAALAGLHYRRWESRGGSAALIVCLSGCSATSARS